VTSGSGPAFLKLMKMLLIGVLVMLTAACGAYRFPGGDQQGSGTVAGKVEVIGCGPVQPAGGVCAPGKTMAGVELDFNGDGAVRRAFTDSNGGYAIELPAATYKVSLKAPLVIVSGPSIVTVQAGSSVVANYVADSGIRAPVPQQ
jgi:hypothetical protein